MAQRSVEEVIKSLLLQIARRYCLCPQLGRVDRTILALLEAITADELCNIEDAALDNPIRLKFEKDLSELRSRGTVRIVIDGLDELENYQACRILSVLSGVSSTHRSLAAVLVFSRQERFLETEFDYNSLGTCSSNFHPGGGAAAGGRAAGRRAGAPGAGGGRPG